MLIVDSSIWHECTLHTPYGYWLFILCSASILIGLLNLDIFPPILVRCHQTILTNHNLLLQSTKGMNKFIFKDPPA